MINFLADIVAVLILFPFLVTIFIVVAMRKKGKSLSKVLGHAADWTTPFLFISVYVIIQAILGQNSTLYIIAFAVIIASLYAVFERTRVKEFIITRLFRKIWRLFFLILTIVYLLAILTGLILNIIEYTN